MTNNTSSSSSQTSSSRASEERSYAHDDHYDEPNLRNRKARSPEKKNGRTAAQAKPDPKPRSASRTPKLGVDYTKEQKDLVERIRHCKDYYEILKVDKKASDDDIRKEYRKMALKLHPDKCRAPHATEAFKGEQLQNLDYLRRKIVENLNFLQFPLFSALGNAYAVLSDTDKRRQYDQFGAEATNGSAPTSRRHGGGGGAFFEHDYAHGFEGEWIWRSLQIILFPPEIWARILIFSVFNDLYLQRTSLRKRSSTCSSAADSLRNKCADVPDTPSNSTITTTNSRVLTDHCSNCCHLSLSWSSDCWHN